MEREVVPGTKRSKKARRRTTRPHCPQPLPELLFFFFKNRSAPDVRKTSFCFQSEYAFTTYCSTIRWVLKNEPLSAMACLIRSMKRKRSR